MSEIRLQDSENNTVYFGITEDGDAEIAIGGLRSVSARFCTVNGGDTRPESRVIRDAIKTLIAELSQPVSIGPKAVSIEPTTEPPTLRPGATVRVLKDTKSINGLNLPAGQLLRVTSCNEGTITARIGEHGEWLVCAVKIGDVEVVG